jgi:hypothetical protein
MAINAAFVSIETQIADCADGLIVAVDALWDNITAQHCNGCVVIYVSRIGQTGTVIHIPVCTFVANRTHIES